MKITLRTGQTKLDKEVFEELAGRDVTLEIRLPGGVTWSINGQNVPTNTDLTDLNLGVDLGTSGISVDVINTVTGELGSVQITLAHNGEFGFALTLTAPLGKENAGYWANLYHYDEDAQALNYETSAQINDKGRRLPAHDPRQPVRDRYRRQEPRHDVCGRGGGRVVL